MNKKISIGLLGLAGNYGRVNISSLEIALRFALEEYDLIDVSTDYGIEFNLVEEIKKIINSNEDIKANFIYKIGCEYTSEYNPNELINRTSTDLENIGLDKFNSILFHRPDIKKISSDIHCFKFLSKEYPQLDIGISTNSSQIYSLYKKYFDIDIVQVALNPLDFKKNLPFVDLLIKDNIQIQARSVLSNGLLSGKYDETYIFKDEMRKRYHLKENKNKYLNRIKTSSQIADYLNERYEISLDDIPIFLYSLFQEMPSIDHVIRGGSTLNQMKNNLRSIKINNDIKKDILKKMIHSWSCEYV